MRPGKYQWHLGRDVHVPVCLRLNVKTLTAGILVSIVFAALSSFGQTVAPSALTSTSTTSTGSSSGDPLANKFNEINFDHAPSGVPAFDALGLSPESVTSPSTPRELASDLLNGVDKNGALQHGLAVETAPFRLIGIRTNLRDYEREDPSGMICRWVYNFSVSAATSKAVDKSDAVQLALGFKEVLYESPDHDPYRNEELKQAFAKSASQIPLSDDLDNPGTPLPAIPASASKVFSDAVNDFYKNKWQGSIWTAAIAPTWNSDSGKLSDLSGTGFTAWSAFAYGTHKNAMTLGDNSPINVQVIGELRYRQGEQVTDPNNKANVASQNSFLAAARIRMGADSFNGFAEGGYARVWHGLNGDGDTWRGAVGVEKKIMTNVWLVISAGQQFGEATAKTNDLFVLSSLRFGTADKAQFAQ
jgi:hypothetical protein